MKRTLSILLAVVLLSLSFTTFALAASTTVPPKTVCMTDWQYSYAFVIKLAGPVKTSVGSVKFYNINGEVFLGGAGMPLAGSGRVKGTEFNFSVTGSDYLGGTFWTVLLEGLWDLADTTNPVGTVAWRQITNTGTNLVESGTLSLTDCSTLVVP